MAPVTVLLALMLVHVYGLPAATCNNHCMGCSTRCAIDGSCLANFGCDSGFTPLVSFAGFFGLNCVGIPSGLCVKSTNPNLVANVAAYLECGTVDSDGYCTSCQDSSCDSAAAPVSSPTGTPSSSATGTPSPSATGTPSSSHTGTPSSSATGTPSSSHTGTPSSSYTGTPSSSHTGTPSSSHTGTPKLAATGTPSSSHTGTPSSSHTGTPKSATTGTPSSSHTGTSLISKSHSAPPPCGHGGPCVPSQTPAPSCKPEPQHGDRGDHQGGQDQDQDRGDRDHQHN